MKENKLDHEYLIFSEFRNKLREVIIFIAKILRFLLIVACIISSLMFIINEMNADENFKIMFYVIKYIYKFAPLGIWYSSINTIYTLLNIKKDDVHEYYSPKLIFMFQLCYLILIIIGLNTIINLTVGEGLLLIDAIANNSILEALSVIKVTIITFIIAGAIKYYFDEKIIINDKCIDKKIDTSTHNEVNNEKKEYIIMINNQIKAIKKSKE